MQFNSVQFSRSVVSESLRPHESQHARPPCPSPTPGIHSDLRPSSWWCHPAISSSWGQSQNNRIVSFHFQGKPFNITVIHVYAPTSNAEEAEVEGYYEDLLELTPQKDVLFIIGEGNAEVGSQEIPGITGKSGLGLQNKAGQRLIESG